MEWVALFALLILILLVRDRIQKAERRIKELEARIAAGARGAEPAAQAGIPPIPEEPLPPAVVRPVPKRPAMPPLPRKRLVPRPMPPAAQAEEPPAPEPAAQVGPPPVGEPSRAPITGEEARRWRSLEKQIIEHWTGILGAAIVVAGVAFIGISVALYLSPFLRSAMIALGAGALVGLALYLKPRPAWAPLSQWLMSSGAAIFLFACFGSGALPALRWVENEWGALGVLVLGIAANLYLAWSVASQDFASLHAVLSLIPLAIIPQSRISLLLAAIVTLAAVGLSFRSRWDRHLLVTLAAYALFHLQWYMETGLGAGEDTGLRLTGLACALLVGIATALVHYRQDYRSEALETLPFAVHLANWGMMGMAGLLYSQRTPLRGIALMAGGVLAFLLARHGRKVGVRWVYLTDTLVAQGLVALGILSFHGYVFDRTLVVAFLFAETALFLRIVADAGEAVLKRAGLLLLHGSALVLCMSGLMAMQPGGAGANMARALVLLASGAVGAAIHLHFLGARGEGFDSLAAYDPSLSTTKTPTSILGVLTCVILMGALLNMRERLWMELVALASVGLVILLARRCGSRGLAIGAWVVMGFVHLVHWGWIFQGEAAGGTGDQLARLTPLAALSLLAIRYAPIGPLQNSLRRAAIYLLGLHIGISAFFVSRPFSPLIPGVLWLTLCLVALEIAGRLREGRAAAVLQIGYLYVAGFLAQYGMVYLQTHTYLGPVPVRAVIEAFALGSLAYWWAFKPGDGLSGLRTWKQIHPLFLELLILFLAVTVVVEAAPQSRPVLWCLLAFVCLFSALSDRIADRLRLYALFFFWGSAIDLAVVTSAFAEPDPAWYRHPGFTGGIAILFMIAWLVRSHGRLGLEKVRFPAMLGAFQDWSRAIAARPPIWIYYPFFVSVALFLYWRFDRSVLTLLWSAEAFAVFVLSAVLRENHFRYMALAAMAACLVRLIGFDLSQSDTLVRGLVFLGVGILMLSMNTIYNRFRARF